MDLSDRISHADFEAWKDNPITQALHRYCRDKIDDLIKEWADVSLANDALWQEDRARFLRTSVKTKVETLQAIIEADFAEEEDDTESDGDHPNRI